MEITIEEYREEDIDSITTIWNEVIDEGKSFFWRDQFSLDSIKCILDQQVAVYCAKFNDEVVGFYILHDNFPGRGNHISNALFAVREKYRCMDIGRQLGEHSLKTSKVYGYKAMQFNSVVSTNTASVRLWKNLGFSQVGQIKGAFIQDDMNAVDIYIYYKMLD